MNKNKNFCYNEKDIIFDYQSGQSLKTIGKKIGVDKSVIKRILLKNKIELRQYNYNQEDINTIVKLYKNGKTAAQISRELFFPANSVERILKNQLPKEDRKNHIKNKLIDPNFFDNIDTEQKAYIFGLICADGWIIDKNSGAKIGISLQEKDVYLLYNISNILYKKNIVSLRKRILILKSKKIKNEAKEYIQGTLFIYGRNVVENFKKHGCGERKSKTLRLNFDFIDSLKKIIFIGTLFVVILMEMVVLFSLKKLEVHA